MPRFGAVLVAILALGPASRAAEEKKDAPKPDAVKSEAAKPDAKADSTLEEARAHAAKAKTHYQLGEFEQAANEYILVYRLKPVPILLYNIAQAYRSAGLYEKAKQFYKSYLREDPSKQAALEKTLKEIDELLAKEKKTREGNPKGIAKEPVPPGPASATGTATAGTPAATEKPPAPGDKPAATPAGPSGPAVATDSKPAAGTTVAMTTSTTTPAPGKAIPSAAAAPAPRAVEKSHTVAWVLAGTSVALLGGGTVFFAKASSTDSNLQNNFHTRAEADSLISSSKSSHSISAVLLGAGAAAAAAAVILFVAQ